MARSRTRRSKKTIRRRRKTSMKNKKYYAGDYAEQIINGKATKCVYPDNSDKSWMATLGFRKNCSSIPGFVPSVTEPMTTNDAVVSPETVSPEPVVVPSDTTATTEAAVNASSVPTTAEEEAATAPLTNTVMPKGGKRSKKMRKYKKKCNKTWKKNI